MTKHMINPICLTVVVLFLALGVASPATGDVYYVDCSNPGGTGGTGSFADQFESKADVMAHAISPGFANGDDIYFLDNSTCSGNVALDITWEGSGSNNWSIIGCYTSQHDFTCATKPIISRNTSGGSAIEVSGMAYIQIQDLNIRNTHGTWWGEGIGNTGITHNNITEKNVNPIRVLRCDFYHWGHYAVVTSFAGDYSIFKDNTVTECGNGIYLTGEGSPSSSYVYAANNTCNKILGYDPSSPTTGRVDGHCVCFGNFSYSLMENNYSLQSYTGAFNTMAIEGQNVWTRFNIMRNNVTKDILQMQSMHMACQGNANGDPDCYGNIAYNNIIIENEATSINAPHTTRGAFNIIEMKPTTGENSFFNNTIYKAMWQGMKTRDAVDGAVLLNNIVVTDELKSDAYVTYLRNTGGNSGSRFDIDNNLYWSIPGDPSSYNMWHLLNGSDVPFASWDNTYDKNAPLPANPLFTDAANDDFTLQQGSPAVDAGAFLSFVSYIGIGSGNGNEIIINNPYRFHGNFGIRDENGNIIEGMQVSFYDATNGRQDREITSVNYGTRTLTLNAPISYIYDSGNQNNPANNTQIALRFSGNAPDIGAHEYNGDTTPPAKPTRLEIIE